jgi:hypothetical protein
MPSSRTLLKMAVRLTLALSAMLVAHSPVFADGFSQIYSTDAATVLFGDFGTPQNFSGGPSPTVTVQTANASGSVSTPDASGTASASSSGSVLYGAIDGSVRAASAGSDSGGPGILPAQGFAAFLGDWEDTLTVTSNSLALGTPVSLLFTLAVNSSTSCSSSLDTNLTVASLNISGAKSVEVVNTACNVNLDQTEQELVATSVGSALNIEGFLNLKVTSNPTNGSSAAVSIDPTSAVFVDSETAGAGYLSASGKSYVTPPAQTPEPASSAMLAIGLLALAIWKIRA